MFNSLLCKYLYANKYLLQFKLIKLTELGMYKLPFYNIYEYTYMYIIFVFCVYNYKTAQIKFRLQKLKCMYIVNGQVLK